MARKTERPDEAAEIPQPAKTAEHFAKRYRAFARQSGPSILDLAVTVYEADITLKGFDQADFYLQIRLHRTSATASKLRTIGEARARFEPYLDRLPNTWTTLYELAKMKSLEFDKVTDALSPFVTLREINELLPKESTRAKSLQKLQIDVSTLAHMAKPRQQEFRTKLDTLLKEFNLAVEKGKNTLDALFEKEKPEETAPQSTERAA